MRMLALLLLLGLGACAKSPPPGGRVVTLDKACDEPSETDVRITGWFRYPRTMMGFCSSYGGKKTCDMSLYGDPEPPPPRDILHPTKDQRPRLKLSVPVGDDPGEMAPLPKSYSDADVILHLAGDRKAGEGSKVTVLGKIKVVESAAQGDAPATKTCWLDVAWATE
jgi:hypothetical protein